MGVACFLIEPIPFVKRGFRRYAHADRSGCPATAGYHQALVWDRLIRRPVPADGIERLAPPVTRFPRSSWPGRCEGCGYLFVPEDYRQVWEERLYERPDTGERFILGDAPPGAMWDSTWAAEFWRGDDGRSLVVKLPDGTDWQIDGRASHCRMAGTPHHCWTRHGEPPLVTVDGTQCAGGSYSVQSPRWHGYLRDGVLQPC